MNTATPSLSTDHIGLPGAFNIFEAIDLCNSEELHSNVLAFLLDPRKPHGIGDRFARELLRAAAVDSAYDDLAGLTVEREWQHGIADYLPRLDLVLRDATKRHVFFIENKVWSKEREAQLRLYREIVPQYHPSWTHAGIYLTPKGIEPQLEADQKYYKTLSYAQVAEVLERLLDECHTLSAETHLFIRQYIDIVWEYIADASGDVAAAYKQLVDERLQQVPKLITSAHEELQVVLSKKTSQRNEHSNEYYFAPNVWCTSKQLTSGTWGQICNLMLVFYVWIEPEDGSVTLSLYMGSGDPQVESELRERVDANIPLLGRRRPIGGWTVVYEWQLVGPISVRALKAGRPQADYHTAWHAFLTHDLPKIRAIFSALAAEQQ